MTTPLADTLSVETASGVQTWIMHSPPVNALDPTLIQALNDHLDSALADESVGAIVLASDLRVFSAGADAAWMREVVSDRGPDGLLAEFNALMDRFRQLCLRLRQAPILVVAAVEGHALAGGLELAAACDLRFAADREDLRLGVPEMALFGAMPSGGGGVQYLARLMGPSAALLFVLDAQPISPRQALTMGLVDRLSPPDQLRQDVTEFAVRVVAQAGRIGISGAKRSILSASELPLAEALDVDHDIHWDVMRRGNFLQGVAKFTERFGK